MQKTKRLKLIYDQVPKIKCKGLCSDACAYILMSKFEQKIINDKYGTCDLLQNPCPKLVNGRCSIYEDRPYVCRAYGVAPGLECPFGCTAEATMSAKQSMKLFSQVDEL